jgi:hypothetical protein
MTEAASPGGGESADEFARIDLISNHTVFQHQEHYQALLRGQDLPVDTFSSFVHEATHHWCFTSPVGTALSLLYLSAAKKAIQWMAAGKASDANDAVNDLWAFEIGIDSLRPLNEGLAQFAEYDILPSEKTSLVSPPLNAALLHLFKVSRRLANAPADDPTSVRYGIADDISRWRLSRKTIDRKSELLLQPVGTHRGAYLLGYLTVKQLWKNAARFRDELKEADVFLMFLRKLIFGDYSLVAEILDRNRPGMNRAVRFAALLEERLAAIRFMTFEEIPWSELQKLLARPPAEARSQLHPADMPFVALDRSKRTSKRAMKGLELFRKYLRDVAVPVRVPGGGGFNLLNLIRERHLMWLGDLPAKWVSIGPKLGCIMIDGEIFVKNFKLKHASDRNLDKLKLDIYISLYEDYQLTTVSNDRGVFGFVVKPWGEGGKRARASLTDERLVRREIVRTIAFIREVMRVFLEGTTYREALADFWSKIGRELLDRTYSLYAFDSNKAAESLFTQQGVADVLQNDSSLVRNVAAISLAASAEMSPEGLLSMSNLPLDPLGTIRRVNELWKIDDFQLVGIGDDGFLRSAF